jgi:hypothetical protein
VSQRAKLSLTVLVLAVAALLLAGGGGGAFVTSGPRQVLIVHESEEQTPAFAEMVRDLRIGPHAEYLKSKGHPAPLVLDDETPGPDGSLSGILAPWKPFAVPELLILKDGKLVKREPLPAPPAAVSVIDALKKAGG